MTNPYALKVGDKLRTSDSLRGKVFSIAAGCVVIEWQHSNVFDPLRLTSQMWRYLERDE